MSQLPVGTVTFLFTDIEGSTRLAQALSPAVFTRVLEQHHRLLRSAFAAHGGVERGTEGDAFLVIFSDAPSAVAAAVEAQRSIGAAEWPDGVKVRVRMGLHSGEGIRGGDDYVGIDINRAARIAAAGHGGQVLLSDAARALSQRSLPAGTSIRDLGEHLLKDLDLPERICQLAIEGLPSAFPPLRTRGHGAVLLPDETTSFVGRAAELAAASSLIAAHRLLTLTGPGGTGKTRLAICLARMVAERFADGVAFVPLAVASSAEQIPNAIAQTLGIPEATDRPMFEVVREHLRERQMLLVLDNLEQIPDAAPAVADLFATSKGVRIVATSRGPLHLSGEQEFPVPALATSLSTADDRSAGGGSDAVRLFVDRASLVRPNFAPTTEELQAIQEICVRLDGLPLAIELAAARTRLFAPRAILERLAQRIDALSGGPADLPQRHRSLGLTIQWSHDLLKAPERALFRRLGVFVGGAAIESIEAVCGDAGGGTIGGSEVVDALAGLVDQSLITRDDRDGLTRFAMLETIREYAVDQLEASGEAIDMRAQHTRHFLSVAEEAERHARGPQGPPLFARLEADQDNLRSILARALAGEDPEPGLRLAGALAPFWVQRNRMDEGRRATDALLARSGSRESIGRAATLLAGSELATWRGDYGRARTLGEESVAELRRLGDRPRLANALASFGFSMIVHDADAALRLFDEADAIFRDLGAEIGIGTTGLARGTALLHKGDLVPARAEAERSVEILERFDEPYFLVFTVGMLGRLQMLLGDREPGLANYSRMLTLARKNGLLLPLATGLDYCAEVVLAEGDAARAMRLCAASERVKEEIGGGISLSVIIHAVDVREAAGERLSTEEFEAAEAAGRAMTLDEAVADALALR
ncbi:MAG: adenylate/guanylate cyclase domain-containing protein [Candidatus Limnocylindria bacterium]